MGNQEDDSSYQQGLNAQGPFNEESSKSHDTKPEEQETPRANEPTPGMPEEPADSTIDDTNLTNGVKQENVNNDTKDVDSTSPTEDTGSLHTVESPTVSSESRSLKENATDDPTSRNHSRPAPDEYIPDNLTTSCEPSPLPCPKRLKIAHQYGDNYEDPFAAAEQIMKAAWTNTAPVQDSVAGNDDDGKILERGDNIEHDVARDGNTSVNGSTECDPDNTPKAVVLSNADLSSTQHNDTNLEVGKAKRYEDLPSIRRLREFGYDSPSLKRWISIKEETGLEVEAFDDLMLKPGLEEAKVHFLSIIDEVQSARSRDGKLSEIKLDIAVTGNKGMGKSLVVGLYKKFLRNLNLVSDHDDDVGFTGNGYYSSSFPAALLQVKKAEKGRGVRVFDKFDKFGDTDDLEKAVAHIQTLMEPDTEAPVYICEGTECSKDDKMLEFLVKTTPLQPQVIKLHDYTAQELSEILRYVMRRDRSEQIAEGGWNGPYVERFLKQTIANTKAKSAAEVIEQCLKPLEKRREDRINALGQDESLAVDEDIYFTKSDMLGRSAAEIGYRSKAWKELQAMIGLTEVKQNIQQLLGQIALNDRLKLAGTPVLEGGFNRCCFIGPPGTGKTSVARLYAQILVDLGLVNGKIIIEKRASDLIGEYVGHSEAYTKHYIDKAKGGVLIIDDFSLLLPGSTYDTGVGTDVFRAAIIDTLVANIDPNSKRKEAFILIGYPESMDEAFEKANPGLTRRFPLKQAFRFAPFDENELSQILDLKLSQSSLTAKPKALKVAMEILSVARHRPNFGNGGEVDNLLNLATMRRNARCAASPVDEDLELDLLPEDFDPDFDRAMEADRRCETLFKDMQGMPDIISRFQGYQRMTARLRSHGHDPRRHIPWALVFRGPPGTGKTTVARKIGQIYYDMGFLSAPEVIECSVTNLISAYVGESGKRVVRMFEKALGKVLFIDEAYRLAENKAVDSIGEMVDCMTKERFYGNLVIVLAGYREDMENLMRWNRGLRSRFSTSVDFYPMEASDILALLQKRLEKVDIELSSIDPKQNFASAKVILRIVSRLASCRSWANGRDVDGFSRSVIEYAYTREESEIGRSGKKLVVPAADLIRLLKERLSRAREEDKDMKKHRARQTAQYQDRNEQLLESEDESEVETLEGTDDVVNSPTNPTQEPRNAATTLEMNIFLIPSPGKEEKASVQVSSLDAGSEEGISEANAGRISELLPLSTAVELNDHSTTNGSTVSHITLDSFLPQGVKTDSEKEYLKRFLDSTQTSLLAEPSLSMNEARLQGIQTTIWSFSGNSSADRPESKEIYRQYVQYYNDLPTLPEGLGMEDIHVSFQPMTVENLMKITLKCRDNENRDLKNDIYYVYAQFHLFRKTNSVDHLAQAIARQEDRLRTIDPADSQYELALRILIVLISRKAVYHVSQDDRRASERDAVYNLALENLRASIWKAEVLLSITDKLSLERFPRWCGLMSLMTKEAIATGKWAALEKFRAQNCTAAMEAFKCSLNIRKETRDGPLLGESKILMEKLKDGIAALPPNMLEERNFLLDLLASIAMVYWNQHDQDQNALEEAIRIGELAVPATPAAMKPIRLVLIGTCLAVKYQEYSTQPEDLQSAIRIIQDAINLGPHKYYISCLESLHGCLVLRYQHAQCPSDLERAVQIMEQILVEVKPDHNNIPHWKDHLAIDLANLFKISKGSEARAIIDRAIGLNEAVLSYIDKHPNEEAVTRWLCNYATNLGIRYERTGSIRDLDLARQLHERAIGPPYDGRKDRPRYLANYAVHLLGRYHNFGRPEDIDAAIAKGNEALSQSARFFQDVGYFPEKAQLLHTVQTALTAKYDVTGDLDLLRTAVKRGEEAILEAIPQDPVKRAYLNNQAGNYLRLYQHLGQKDDLFAAVQRQESALQMVHLESEDRPLLLTRMTQLLAMRYQSNRQAYQSDLDRAIRLMEQAVSATPDGNLNEAGRISTLAQMLLMKWEVTKDPGLLDEVISKGQKADTLTNPESPVTAESKFNLASAFSARYSILKSIHDLDQAIKNSKDGLNHAFSPAHKRILCGILAVNFCIQAQTPQRMIEGASIAEQTVQLLPTASSRALKQVDQQHVLKDFAGLATIAVALAFDVRRSASHCLGLLELGRGIINGLRFDSRVDLTMLQNKDENLFKRFTSLRSQLEEQDLNARPAEISEIWAGGPNARATKRHDLTTEFKDLLQEIQRLEGLETFLTSPGAEDLRNASTSAREAVVVINVSHRCDAIIVQNRKVAHLALPDLHKDDIERSVKDMETITENPRPAPEDCQKLSLIFAWLWESLVGPVLENLGFTNLIPVDPSSETAWPRIWWVPTGGLSRLPLHAAGYHPANGHSASALDIVVSSYSPSIKALLYTRRNNLSRTQDTSVSSRKNAILLAYAPTACASDPLQHAKAEIIAIRDILLAKSSLSSSNIKVVPDPTKSTLLADLPHSTIFHFAGHALSSSSDPSNSALLVQGYETDPLTVSDLLSLNLYKRPPFLAYLSACSTAAAKDERLYDEAIHLMSGCQLAGFEHVVGTMWEIDDWEGVGVARDIYGAIKDMVGAMDGNVAWAVHRAVRRLRGIENDKMEDKGESKRKIGKEWGLQGKGGSVRTVAELREKFVKDRRFSKVQFERVAVESNSLLLGAFIHVGL